MTDRERCRGCRHNDYHLLPWHPVRQDMEMVASFSQEMLLRLISGRGSLNNPPQSKKSSAPRRGDVDKPVKSG
jgi:hypothetical protein